MVFFEFAVCVCACDHRYMFKLIATFISIWKISSLAEFTTSFIDTVGSPLRRNILTPKLWLYFHLHPERYKFVPFNLYDLMHVAGFEDDPIAVEVQ